MDPVDVPAVLEIFSTSADGRWFVGLVVKQVGGGWLEIREGAGIWVSVVGVFEKKHHQKKTVDSKIGQHFFLVVLVVRGVFFFFVLQCLEKEIRITGFQGSFPLRPPSGCPEPSDDPLSG